MPISSGFQYFLASWKAGRFCFCIDIFCRFLSVVAFPFSTPILVCQLSLHVWRCFPVVMVHLMLKPGYSRLFGSVWSTRESFVFSLSFYFLTANNLASKILMSFREKKNYGKRHGNTQSCGCHQATDRFPDLCILRIAVLLCSLKFLHPQIENFPSHKLHRGNLPVHYYNSLFCAQLK